MYNWKMFVGNIMLDKVNKNNYINYISDKTEIKNKKINIDQGKILVKSFWYATLSSLLLLIISYVFYFIWSKTFVSKIYVSSSSTYIVFGLCTFFIIASFVCSHIKIKKRGIKWINEIFYFLLYLPYFFY